MISHFQWSEKKNNWLRKEWAFSFYFKGEYYSGVYFKDGSIAWDEKQPSSENKNKVEAQIHDLILYHVFEDHTPPM